MRRQRSRRAPAARRCWPPAAQLGVAGHVGRQRGGRGRGLGSGSPRNYSTVQWRGRGYMSVQQRLTEIDEN